MEYKTDYNKVITTPSETVNSYVFKDEKVLKVVRKYKDYLQPKTGITTKRELLGISVTGMFDVRDKEEIRMWLKNRCTPPIPKLIKKFMEEQ